MRADCSGARMTILLLVVVLVSCCVCQWTQGFVPNSATHRSYPMTTTSLSSSLDTAVDPNVYNVDVETAADLWTVSVSAERNFDRQAGIPYLDCKSKDYFVDDVQVEVKRDGGMGLELLELAGAREDDYGLTIVSGVGGNAEQAGIVPGDSISRVRVVESESDGISKKESVQILDCECRNFDATIGLLNSLPPHIESVTLSLKRIRRWPKVKVTVEYPPIQCADGVSNEEEIELFAGENLKRALQNRGIVLEDRKASKCDFCGGKCTVKIEQGMQLMNPMSMTEEKLMRRNPKCRLSCKTSVGHNMQEGFVRLKVNLNEWNEGTNDQILNPFFSR